MNILEACARKDLFAPAFRDAKTFRAWFAFLAALFGLRLDEDGVMIYKECTGRSEVRGEPYREAWLVCGRRAGKSFVLALIAVFLACFRNYQQYLSPGERATVAIIAADRRQARTIFRYVLGLMKGTPLLEGLIERETADAIDLSNGVTIEIHTASLRTMRGYTFAGVLCDELAFWRSEDSADPDREIIGAIRPGLATIPGSMLLCASSPYSRRGVLWECYKEHYGKDSDILVWQAPTKTMNPTIEQSEIDRALERDASHAGAEYLALFRSDVEAFVTHEAVDGCTSPGVLERPYNSAFEYIAFCDPSGGSSDSMTLALAHREGDLDILDLVRERKAPFSPEACVADFAQVLKSYRVSKVIGDRYAGSWPSEAFSRYGITYEPSAQTKSELYKSLLPRLNSREVDLLDVPRIGAQLVSLERRTSRGGRDSIDHPPGAHDDLANAVAGALVNCVESRASSFMVLSFPI